MGDGKSFTAQALQKVASDGFAGRKTNGMHKAIELGPNVSQSLDHGGDLLVT